MNKTTTADSLSRLEQIAIHLTAIARHGHFAFHLSGIARALGLAS